MTRPDAGSIHDEIKSIIRFLTEIGIADESRYPVRRPLAGAPNTTEITYPSTVPGSTMLDKNATYAEAYATQNSADAYNLKMPDGALIQMSYVFRNKKLRSARLAFLPSPELTEYDNDPDSYDRSQIFAEITDPRIVTVPLRFDYDPEAASDVAHPASHATFGQYQNCRVPAAAPLTPGLFIHFILRSFYAMDTWTGNTPPLHSHRFDRTITPAEQNLVHIGLT